MDTAANALVFFYGVLWATAVAGASRYQAFDTAALFLKGVRGRAARRLVVAFLILTFAPITWVLLLYLCVVPHERTLGSIASAAVSAVSVFGFVRLFHAFVASDGTYKHFYSSEEIRDVRCRKAFTESQSQSFWAHLLPGLGFLFGFALLGCWVGKWRLLSILLT